MLCVGLILVLWCQPPKPPPVSDVARFCMVARPIAWSRRDTEETIRAVKAHNAAGVKVCAWKAKP